LVQSKTLSACPVRRGRTGNREEQEVEKGSILNSTLEHRRTGSSAFGGEMLRVADGTAGELRRRASVRLRYVLLTKYERLLELEEPIGKWKVKA
jgi:hypothetical protein